MQRKTAFVTGGSGFVGRNLIGALVRAGWQVRALARSNNAAAAVEAIGANAARGDLDASIDPGLIRGCDVVFHAAATTNDFPNEADAWRTNVEGTRKLVDAARAAGATRFVQVSTEAVLIGGRPIVNADETWPLPEKPLGLYARTKGAAERVVREANGPGFATVIARPRFIWGAGDTTLLPKLIEGTKSGALVWIGGGRNLTSTCHIDNCIEGLLLCAERGSPGETYFFTDGAPVEFRSLVERLLHSQEVAPPTRSIPYAVAHAFARTTETLYRVLPLKGRPALPHASFHLIADEVTVCDAKARRELGYVGRVSHDAGFAAMHRSAR
jgi:nucleoside-diphosphate-sugar epimerase